MALKAAYQHVKNNNVRLYRAPSRIKPAMAARAA